ncbi:hypothetical protein BG005_003524 [Podila minutissima]|nr:hypothetical protein BG005_003524 [Podila minutissima]
MNPPETTTRRATTRAPTGTKASTPARTNTGTRSTTVRRTTSSSPVISPSTTPTASPNPETGGGLSGGAIGGIAAGVVVVFALVGLVFYKRRKRIAAEKKSDKEEPIYMNASNYSSKKNGSNGDGGGISGPLALAGDDDYGGAAVAFVKKRQHASIQEQDGPYGIQKPSQARARDNGPMSPGPRSPGGPMSPGGPRSPPDGYLSDHGPGGGNGARPGPGGYDHRNDHPMSPTAQHKSRSDHGEDDYYDVHNDYYGGPEQPIGAQRSPAHARDVTHGNLTPAPEYYLGKEDIDPRRDLRGLDTPDTYVNSNKKAPKASSESRQGMLRGDSPRSSISSDNESVYLTLEQAQQAHHQKMMMGHKASVGSAAHLQDRQNGPSPKSDRHGPGPLSPTLNNGSLPQRDPRYDEPLSSPRSEDLRFAPEHASMAISDSTMSMMPSLPPINSPMAYNPARHGPDSSRGGGGGRTNAQQQPGKGSSDPLSPTAMSSMSGMPHDDPYAETAYSEDYPDNRSLISSGYPQSNYNSPHQYPQKNQYPNQPPRNNGYGSPSHKNHPPPGRGYGGPPQHNNNYQYNNSNNNGHGSYPNQGYNQGHNQGHNQGYNQGYQGYQGNGYSNGPYQGPIRNGPPGGGGYGPPRGGGGYGPARVASPAPSHRPRQAPPF